MLKFLLIFRGYSSPSTITCESVDEIVSRAYEALRFRSLFSSVSVVYVWRCLPDGQFSLFKTISL